MSKRKVAVDECIGEPILAALECLYGSLGYDFISVRKLGGGEDEDWAVVFKRFGGEIVLSGDINIAKKPHQQAAFVDTGLICYFPKPPFQQLKLHKQAAYLTHNWKLIHEHLSTVDGASCWCMPTSYREESLTLNHSPFKRMQIPKEILSEMAQVK